MPASSTMISWLGLIVFDESVTWLAVMLMRASSRSNGLDAFLNCCWSLPSCWISALIRSGSLRAISMAMVLLSQPMLLRSSSTALWLVASRGRFPRRTVPAMPPRLHGRGFPVPAGPMMLLTSRGFSNAYAAAFFLVLCQRIAALGFVSFRSTGRAIFAFAMRVADIGGLVESFDHVLFGLKHVLGRVFVEVRVVEHASALVRGEAQIIHHVFRQLVPVGCEFDALAEPLSRLRSPR